MNNTARSFLSRQQQQRPTRLIASMVMALMLANCASVRNVTYPPDFLYLNRKDVQNAMQEMARHVIQLHQLVMPGAEVVIDRPAPVAREEVVAELDSLERIAQSLSGAEGELADAPRDAGRRMTNHLLIDEHINDFIAQIERARWLVDDEPPNYYGVGQIAGNCLACHRLR